MTRWKYSGGVDLILTNARYDQTRERVVNHITGRYKQGLAYLDFSTAIVVNLDKAKADNAILSIETFFEQIFQYAETQEGDDPAWGFSDHMAMRVTSSAFKSLTSVPYT
jgi:hypothetical protein